jgi:asparagine synthase (glutamine-hydrolysing)
MSYFLYLHNIPNPEAATKAFRRLPGDGSTSADTPKQTCLGKKFAHEPKTFAQIGQWFLAGSLTLYNRKELTHQLQLKNNTSDAEIALQAFLKWEEAFPKKLDGDFSLVIFREDSDACFVARDIWGMRPLYHQKTTSGIAFSNHPTPLTALMQHKKMDAHYLADSITGIKSERDCTFLKGLKRIPPAHAGWWSNNQLHLKRYYALQESQPHAITDKTEAIAHFRVLLQKAVAKRTADLPKVATELSGGVDSSTITALAAANTHTEAFSHRMRDEDLGKFPPWQDEREWAEDLTTHAGMAPPTPIISTTRGVLAAIKDSYQHTGQIPQQGYYMLSTLLYETAAQKGHTVLLSGFGGDEMVTSPAGGYPKELIASGKWKRAWQFMRTNEQKSLLKTAKGFSKQLFAEIAPGTFQVIQNQRAPHWSVERWPLFPIQEAFCRELEQKQRYDKYHTPVSPFSVQQHQLERLTHNHASQRLEYSWLAAAWHGIEYRYPLFDKELVEFYYHLPAELKRAEGFGRYIFRKATTEILPPSLQWRTEKAGATIPDVHPRVQKDKEAILQILTKYQNHPEASRYIDFDKLLQQFSPFGEEEPTTKNRPPFAVVFNVLKYLHFLEENHE